MARGRGHTGNSPQHMACQPTQLSLFVFNHERVVMEGCVLHVMIMVTLIYSVLKYQGHAGNHVYGSDVGSATEDENVFMSGSNFSKEVILRDELKSH